MNEKDFYSRCKISVVLHIKHPPPPSCLGKGMQSQSQASGAKY